MSLFAKIRGTIETLFQLGLGGPQLKNNGGAIEARNATDTGFAVARGATPVAANDLTTKAYVDAGDVGAGGAVQEIRFAIALVTVSSITSIPNNSIVIDCELNITTPYSGGATISVGNAATPALLMGTGDNNPQANGLYQVHQDTTFTPVDPVQVTIAGAPAAGAGFAIVRYIQTPQA